MPEQWYELVSSNTPLTQGDIVLDCPLIGWRDEPVGSSSVEALQRQADAFVADVVVMTQACDLEHRKVKNVVLCPHLALNEYRNRWEAAKRLAEQNPTEKAWKQHCEDLRDGYLWNLAALNKSLLTEPSLSHRVVDFHEIFTVPRQFIESLLHERDQSRLRLLPPYREHLSQAFARFFMRVGLPVEVERVW